VAGDTECESCELQGLPEKSGAAPGGPAAGMLSFLWTEAYLSYLNSAFTTAHRRRGLSPLMLSAPPFLTRTTRGGGARGAVRVWRCQSLQHENLEVASGELHIAPQTGHGVAATIRSCIAHYSIYMLATYQVSCQPRIACISALPLVPSLQRNVHWFTVASLFTTRHASYPGANLVHLGRYTGPAML
jgi:hypothetical protein